MSEADKPREIKKIATFLLSKNHVHHFQNTLSLFQKTPSTLFFSCPSGNVIQLPLQFFSAPTSYSRTPASGSCVVFQLYMIADSLNGADARDACRSADICVFVHLYLYLYTMCTVEVAKLKVSQVSGCNMSGRTQEIAKCRSRIAPLAERQSFHPPATCHLSSASY